MAAKVWNGNKALARRTAPIDSLRPHPRNPRRGVIPEIQESLRRFGQQRTVLALPDGTLVAGHHVWRAAREEGWTHIAVDHSDLTDREVDAYLLADNRLSELGTFDDELLAALLSEQDSLLGTGYDDDYQRQLTAALNRTDRRDQQDVIPPAPETPVSRPGEVYRLGEHTLVCGNSLDQATYDLLLPDGERADTVWTDPPYGVDVVGGSRGLPKERRRAAGNRGIENDTLAPDELTTFLTTAFTLARDATRLGGSWYVAGPAGDMGDCFTDALRAVGMRRHTLVWVKQQLVLSRQDYHYRHEMVYFAWRDGPNRVRPTDRTLTSVLEFDRPQRSAEHPTMKPVDLVEHCIRNSTDPGGVVLDPFGGSGTTMIACENAGLRARMVELDPIYCDVIRQRYADYTGQPHLAPDNGS